MGILIFTNNLAKLVCFSILYQAALVFFKIVQPGKDMLCNCTPRELLSISSPSSGAQGVEVELFNGLMS